MNQQPLVSILIPSFNYEMFLRESIDSALNQTYPHIEVVVVDDGSTDDSPRIIRSYGHRIVPIRREKNAGCHAAYNAGFAQCRGDAVSFLDADDVLLPTAIERAVAALADPRVVKVYWPLRTIDRDGKHTGGLRPKPPLPEGDLREMVLANGPDCYGLTNQGVYPRSFLEEVFPIPEGALLKSGYLDGYLAMKAPFFGRVKALQPLGCYRFHGDNTYQGCLYEVLPMTTHDYEWKVAQLSTLLKGMGIEADTSSWIKNSWWHRVQRTVDHIDNIIPAAETFILIDDDKWGFPETIVGRHQRRYFQANGDHWGPPTDSGAAIEALRRQQEDGIRYLAVAWPAFWWLDYYKEWSEYLHQNARCMLENECICVFYLHK